MTTTPHTNPLGWYPRLLQRVLMRVRPNLLAGVLKRWLRMRRTTVQTPHGSFHIDPVSLLGIALTQRGEHEPAMIATLQRYLSAGATFVDLGANEGYFTVLAARLCGAKGRVLAIEPQRRLLGVIDHNLRLNGLEGVQVVNAAISDKPGAATVYLTASTNTGGSGLHHHSKYPLPSEEVTALTLEQVLDQQGLATVDLMKVDIEGFEYEALLGSPRVFEQRRVKALALELHEAILAHRGKQAGDITAMLERAGYQRTSTAGNEVWLAAVTAVPS